MAHQTLHIQLFGRIAHQPLQYISLKIIGSPNVTHTKVCGHMANQTVQKRCVSNASYVFYVFHVLHVLLWLQVFNVFKFCRLSNFYRFAMLSMLYLFPGLHVLNVFNVFHVFRAGARAGAVGLKVSPCRCHFLGLPHS